MILLTVLLMQTFPLAWAWQIERPYTDEEITDRVENSYTDGYASVGIGAAIDDYDEGAAKYGGSDYISMNVSMTANSRKGITYDYQWQSLEWIDESELSPVTSDDSNLPDN